MKIYTVAEHEKCGGCNWESRFLYYAADSQEQADEMYRENEAGLCGECLIEVFQENNYEIVAPAGVAGHGVPAMASRDIIRDPGTPRDPENWLHLDNIGVWIRKKQKEA